MSLTLSDSVLPKVTVTLDGPNGLAIQACATISRRLARRIDEHYGEESAYSLEVSSPGLDEPLKLLRQYKKNIGRDVEVTMNDDVKKEGKLTAVTEQSITIEYTEGKGKKSIVKKEELPFDAIKQTKIQIKF